MPALRRRGVWRAPFGAQNAHGFYGHKSAQALRGGREPYFAAHKKA